MTIASEITRLQGAKADIKTAIENKGVTVPSADTIDQYAGYIDQIETGTTIVNGVIENYLASTSTVAVAAGTFVAMSGDTASDYSVSGTAVVLDGTARYRTVCESIDDTHFLMVYITAMNKLTACVCTINSSSSISYGTGVTLDALSYLASSVTDINVVKVNSGKFVAAISDNQAQGSKLVPLSADSSTVTVGTAVTFSSQYYLNAICKYADNQVFVAHGYSSPMAEIYEISDGLVATSILSSSLGISSIGSGGSHSVCKRTSDSLVFVYQTTGTLYAVPLSITGSSITAGTAVAISTEVRGGNAVIATTPSSIKIASMSRIDNSNEFCATFSATIRNGSTITAQDAARYDFDTPMWQGHTIAADIKMTPAGIVVAYNGGTTGGNYYLRQISLDTGAKTKYNITSSYSTHGGASVCSTGKYIVTTGYQVVFLTELKAEESTAVVHGFTKTEATTVTPGEVWVLNS